MCFRRIAALFDPKPWYLAGGVPAGACVAAYQPKGASSLAASYTNLANPGVYTAAPGTAPAWVVDTGWQFNGHINSRYLTTGITPTTTAWSYVFKYSNWTSSAFVNYPGFLGAQSTSPTRTIGFHCYDAGNVKYISNGGISTVAGDWAASGVVAMCDRNFYIDGALIISNVATGAVPLVPLFIGGFNLNGSLDNGTRLTANIQALAIFNFELTHSQIVAITTAINAL